MWLKLSAKLKEKSYTAERFFFFCDVKTPNSRAKIMCRQAKMKNDAETIHSTTYVQHYFSNGLQSVSYMYLFQGNSFLLSVSSCSHLKSVKLFFLPGARFELQKWQAGHFTIKIMTWQTPPNWTSFRWCLWDQIHCWLKLYPYFHLQMLIFHNWRQKSKLMHDVVSR